MKRSAGWEHRKTVRRAAKPGTLLSFHDVTPAVLDAVGRLLEEGSGAALRPMVLLVVPGVAWSDADVARLRAWSGRGCRLAGHGWVHRCGPIRTWRHRCHSALLSRNAAEHLGVGTEAIVDLMRACFRWFEASGLDAPALYVPPAWAIGAVSWNDLQRQPFRLVEVLGGLLDVPRRRRCFLPVLGFEADTAARVAALRLSNRVNRAAAVLLRRPLRVAVHPHDDRLRMAADLRRCLRGIDDAAAYEDVVAAV